MLDAKALSKQRPRDELNPSAFFLGVDWKHSTAFWVEGQHEDTEKHTGGGASEGCLTPGFYPEESRDLCLSTQIRQSEPNQSWSIFVLEQTNNMICFPYGLI